MSRWAWLCLGLAAVGAPAAADELELKEPQGVCFDADDHLLVADTGHHRVLELGRELNPVRQFGTGEEGSGPGQLRRPQDVAVDAERGVVVVADTGNHRIAVFARDGRFLRAFGREGGEPGEFRSPTHVTLDGHGRVIVSERWNHRLQVLDLEGRPVSVLANRSGPRSPADADALFEYQKLRNANAKREELGTEWRREDPGQFNEPGGTFYDPALRRVFVANGWNCRIEILDYDSASGTLSRRPPETGIAWGLWVNYGCAGTADGELLGVQTAWGTIRRFRDRAGLTHQSEPYQDVNPGTYGRVSGLTDIAVAPRSGRVAITDSHGDRVLVYGPDFALPDNPRAAELTARGAVITYRTLRPTPTRLRLRASPYPRRTPERFAPEGFGEYREIAGDPAPRTEHRVRLDDLEPATRYYYSVYMPELQQVPGSGWAREYAINTLAPAGQTAFLRIPVRCLLVANIVSTESLPAGPDAADVPPPEPMSEDDVRCYYDDRFRETQLFYWVNSRMLYWLDYDLYVDETLYRDGALPDAAPQWARDLPTRNHDQAFARLIGEAGREGRLYHGQVICDAVRRWDAGRRAWVFQGSGGGTYGVEWPTPGRTHFLGGSDTAWLLCHEYKHQMESQYGHSGLESEDDRNWFCHFSPKFDRPETESVDWAWDTAADHGEHWDGIAWQLRHLTRDQYLRNCFGELLTAADADGDGIPDAAPELPLDEARLGTSPQRPDTDGDGVRDLDELLASTWVTAMLTDTRKRVSVPYIRPDPLAADSDGDGVPDGRDPYPIYPVEPRLPRGTVTVDGDLRDWRAAQKVTFRHAGLGPERESVDVRIAACYDDERLYYGLKIASPHQGLILVVDADADGFYCGNDNFYVELKPDGTLRNARVHLCHKNRWPFFDDAHEYLKVEEVQHAVQADGPVQQIELALPRRPDLGLELQAGQQVGWTLYLHLPSGAPVAVFEPYSFFDSELAAAP